jgi:hypothetical protein
VAPRFTKYGKWSGLRTPKENRSTPSGARVSSLPRASGAVVAVPGSASGSALSGSTRACLQLRRMIAEANWTPARKFLASLS